MPHLTKIDASLLIVSNAFAWISVIAALVLLIVISSSSESENISASLAAYIIFPLAIIGLFRGIVLYNARQKYGSVESALKNSGHRFTASFYKDMWYSQQQVVGLFASPLGIILAVALYVAGLSA